MRYPQPLGIAALLAIGTLAGCGSVNEPRTGLSAEEARAYITNHGQTNASADSLLADRLMTALKSDPMTQGSQIQVTVTAGRARLSGFVHNAAAKLRAAELVQQAEGITAVENRLILRYHAGLAADPLGDARVRL